MNQRQRRTKIKKELRDLNKNHDKIMKYGSTIELAKFHDKTYKLKNQLKKKKIIKNSNKVNELTLNLVFHLADDELNIFNKNLGLSDFKKTLLLLNNQNHITVKFGVGDATKTYITNKYNNTYSKKEKETINQLHFIYLEVNMKYQNKKPLTKRDLITFKWLHYYFSLYKLLSLKSVCKKQNTHPLSIYYGKNNAELPKYNYYNSLYPDTILNIIPNINRTELFLNQLNASDKELFNQLSKELFISSLWNCLNSSYMIPKNAQKEDIVLKDIQFTKTYFNTNERAFIIHFLLQDMNWTYVLRESELGRTEDEYKEYITNEYKNINSVYRDMLTCDLFYLYPSVFEKIK